MQKNIHTQTGFSLIEIMIVIAIVAILMSLSVAVYRQHMHKVYRKTAISDLLQLQLVEERYHTHYGHYADASKITLPTNQQYRFIISEVSDTHYLLSAIAKTDSMQVDDEKDGQSCASLALDQKNKRMPQVCW